MLCIEVIWPFLSEFVVTQYSVKDDMSRPSLRFNVTRIIREVLQYISCRPSITTKPIRKVFSFATNQFSLLDYQQKSLRLADFINPIVNHTLADLEYFAKTLKEGGPFNKKNISGERVLKNKNQQELNEIANLLCSIMQGVSQHSNNSTPR